MYKQKVFLCYNIFHVTLFVVLKSFKKSLDYTIFKNYKGLNKKLYTYATQYKS